MRRAEAVDTGRRSSPVLPGLARASRNKPTGAQPVTGERERPLSAHGRIFFEKAGDPTSLYSCSGTVVRSRKQNLVFTAGHCVYDLETESFNERITFVPAYRDGEAPFGQFPAKNRLTTTGWIGGGGTGHDVGAIAVAGPVEKSVGGRPINFRYNPTPNSAVSVFGYPVQPLEIYGGRQPIVCDSAIVAGFYTGNPPSLAAGPCDMQQGSSGGGWINSVGHLFSVVSHGYCESEPSACGVIFGPRLGNSGLQIYRQAGGSERPKLSISRGPRGLVAQRRVRFRFHARSSTPVTFECRITGPTFRGVRSAFKRCGRNRVYRSLKPGRHVLRVRVTDQTGRRAQLRRAFRIVRPRR